MKQWMRSFLIFGLCLSLLMTAGCSSLFPYQSTEEQKEKETGNSLTGTASGSDKTAIEVKSLQSDDLVYSNTLRNSVGSVLATYSGCIPTFRSPSGYALAFQRINEHFQVQYHAFDEDCQAYFNRVKAYYGENWDTQTVEEPIFHTQVSYQLYDAPEHYLSLEITYTTCMDGATSKTYRLGEVLLLDTGWVLQAAELFGSHYEDALSRVMDDVTQWAVNRSILPAGTAVTFTAEQLLKNFALTETQLVLYLDAYTLAANDAASYVICLNLADYADLITDLEVVGDTDDGQDTTAVTPENSLLPQLPGTDTDAGGSTGE